MTRLVGRATSLTVSGAAVLVVAAVLVAPAADASTVFAESFERVPVGAAATATNTSYDQSIGDSGDGTVNLRVVGDSYGSRGRSVRFYNTSIARTTFGFLGERVGQQSSLYLRRYYKLDSLPSYRTSVLLYKYGGTGNGQLGGTHNGSFAVGGSSQGHRFTLVNNNANTTQSSATAPVNSWFRTEVHLSFAGGHGTQTVRLFLGANVNGTTPTETVTGPLTGPYTDYLEDGIVTNPNTKINLRVDEAANGTGWLGPAS